MTPLQYVIKPDAPGLFGAVRKHDIHTGIDLYCEMNELVYAIQSGVVKAIEIFTGPRAGFPWWNETFAVVIEHEDGSAFVYGELMPCVKVGDIVLENEGVGYAIPVLKKDKGRPMVMLHLERYSYLKLDETGSYTALWHLDQPQPDNLEDPTSYLDFDEVFSMDTYDGLKYKGPNE
jgi:hypothetical protein